MVDDVFGEACEKVKVGVKMMSLAAKLEEFVDGIDVAGNDSSGKVEEVVGDKPEIEDLINVCVSLQQEQEGGEGENTFSSC